MSHSPLAHPSPQAGEQIKIVLFDLGGVLVRFSGLEVLRELTGGDSTELDISARWLMSPSVRRFEAGACSEEEFAAGLVDEWELPYSAAEFLEVFPTWLDPPFEGGEQLLAQASKRVSLGCLSNSNVVGWRAIADWPHARYFEHRFLSFELGAVKPDALIYERVIARLPVDPDQVLFLDDIALNVEGARAAGLRAEQAIGIAGARAALDSYGLLG